jgi:hypothetical protein
MKLIAQSLLTALLLSTATFASDVVTKSTTSANPTVITNSYKVAVYPSTTMTSKLHVVVEREPGQTMTIYLKDAQGIRLAEQQISKKQGTFHFQFDLAALEDGNYSVQVISGNDVALYPVTLKTQPTQATSRTLTLN